MIKLEVKDYCQNCPEFSPTGTSEALYANNHPEAVEHVVKCANEELCAHLKKYLEGVAP